MRKIEEGVNPGTEAARNELMIEELASRLHDMWREPRRIPADRRTEGGPEFEPRIKTVEGVDFDIANLCYRELPEKFKAENKAAATGALAEIARMYSTGALAIDVEILSDAIHKQWMERNGSWAPAEQMVDYPQLPEEEKEKDRVIARAAIEVFEKTNG